MKLSKIYKNCNCLLITSPGLINSSCNH